jgi:hypothetical protein
MATRSCGPVGHSEDSKRIDAGTLCRAPSPIPGPTGQSIGKSKGAGAAPDETYADSIDHEKVFTRIEVRLIGHASPRFKSADSRKEADRLNLELSKKRAAAVRPIIEKAFKKALPAQTLVFNYTEECVSHELGTSEHQITEEARGSTDTLKEAHGDRSSDAPQLRRVDVYTRLTFTFDGMAGASKDYGLVRISEKTRHWAIKIAVSANVHVTAGGSYMYLTLKNRETKTTAGGHVTTLGGGASVKWSPWGVSGNWSDYMDFDTASPMDHGDFNGKGIRVTTFGVSVGIGYEKSYLTIYGVGSGAHSMPTGGWNYGTAGAGGYIDHGNIWVSKPPPRFKRLGGTEREAYRYQKEQTEGHVVNFGNNQSEPSSTERIMLEEFVRRVAADFRLE